MRGEIMQTLKVDWRPPPIPFVRAPTPKERKKKKRREHYSVRRHHLPRPETGQCPLGSRGPCQAHGLRDVQGGGARGRHHGDILRHAQLHRPGDPAGRGLRLLRRLVGPRCPPLRDARWSQPLRHRRGLREPGPEHRGLPLPGHPAKDDPHSALALRQGRLRPQRVPLQESSREAWLR
jgi:hypothetical protein